jgi:hypothetical protein
VARRKGVQFMADPSFWELYNPFGRPCIRAPSLVALFSHPGVDSLPFRCC